jgi:hypothetical protein
VFFTQFLVARLDLVRHYAIVVSSPHFLKG